MPKAQKTVANSDEDMPVASEPKDPNHPSQWKHRRRMAYMSLISIIAVTGIMLGPWVPVERVEKLSDLISWFYFSLASIVGAYMGFATWSAKQAKG